MRHGNNYRCDQGDRTKLQLRRRLFVLRITFCCQEYPMLAGMGGLIGVLAGVAATVAASAFVLLIL
jgi:hypothetical protein